MKRLLLAATAAVALAGCGDDINQLRDSAEDQIQEAERFVRDLPANATLDDVQRELDKVRDELDQSDLPEDARRQLEQARDELEQVADDVRGGN